MRCPVCRVDNNEGPNCRRCRADLSLLFQLEAHRGHLMQRAQQHALRADWAEATRLAAQAHALRKDSDSGRLIAICHLMQSQFAQALEWHARPT
jgi:hypothetical protein